MLCLQAPCITTIRKMLIIIIMIALFLLERKHNRDRDIILIIISYLSIIFLWLRRLVMSIINAFLLVSKRPHTVNLTAFCQAYDCDCFVANEH